MENKQPKRFPHWTVIAAEPLFWGSWFGLGIINYFVETTWNLSIIVSIPLSVVIIASVVVPMWWLIRKRKK